MARSGERQVRFVEATSMAEAERFIGAELLNGRLAMLGITIGIATELLTGKGIITQITYGILGIN